MYFPSHYYPSHYAAPHYFPGGVSGPVVITLTSLAAASGVIGTAPVITFTGTGFAGANLMALISSASVTIGSPSNISATSFKAVFTISGDAGAHDVIVQTDAGISNSLTFTVTDAVQHPARLAMLNIRRN